VISQPISESKQNIENEAPEEKEKATPQLPSVANHRITKFLGYGGSANLWAARHLLLEQNVALKVFRPNRFQRSTKQEDAFLNEARLARTLQHENLLQVFDVGTTEGGEPYFSTTLADGTLDTTRPFEDNINALVGVGMALEHLHSCGIVHCDVKPTNVLRVTRDFAVDRSACTSERPNAGQSRWLLADLGLAWQRSQPVAVGSGSFGYIAPERFGEQPPTPQCDIFSYARLIEKCLRRANGPKFHCGQPLLSVLDAALAADPSKRPSRAFDLAGLLARRASRIS
jgi:eukaryotic-like serine/threonine-protein kinase